jgi:hypothetical protein
MWIFDRWSPYSYQNNTDKYKDDEEKRFFNLKECLWFCMTSLTPQVNSKLMISHSISYPVHYVSVASEAVHQRCIQFVGFIF